MASKYKLRYFDLRGRGEPIRFIFHQAGVDFEDERISFDSWKEVKPTLPFEKLPVLEVDGKTVPQSIAILRYLAKKFGLAGKNDWESFQCDSIVDSFSDLVAALVKFSFEADEDKKPALRKTFLDETVPFFFSKFDQILKKNNGHFVGSELTWADLCVAAHIEFVEARLGQAVLDDKYPNLKALKEMVYNLPAIKSWVAKRPDNPF